MILTRPLHLFEAYGIELEYMIVHAGTLDILPIADQILRDITGAYDSDADRGDLSWSNELMLHVLEFKTNGPAPALEGLPAKFHAAVAEANNRLAAYNARLMPSAMHPWMDPFKEARRWPHEHSAIYDAFDRIFDSRGHGWANLQSLHLNLPFADDAEFARLHAAVRFALPILPAIAASSPLIAGRPTGFQDYRLEAYRRNAERIPSVTGHVIPEPIYTRRDYEEQILGRMYADIALHDPAGILRHEWLNARGAIARFDRNTIEVRVLDIQECASADLAIATTIIALAKALVNERWIGLAELEQWPVEPLETLFLASIADADAAVIRDRAYLRAFGYPGQPPCTARELWMWLRDALTPYLEVPERSLLGPLDVILAKGPLSRRILDALGDDFSRRRLMDVFGQLCDCLAEDGMFHA